MRIELSKCVVRSWRESDAQDLARRANCREVWINLRDAFPHPYTLADAETFLRSVRSSDGPETTFAIEVEGEAAGGISVVLGQDVERVSGEVGFWLGQAFWGRGIMTETLLAVRDIAITTFSLARLHAVCFEWNQGAFRVLEKADFSQAVRFQRSVIKDGKIVDTIVFEYVAPYE